MINFQKIIKYCAIAFAILLIFNIITSIMFIMASIGNIFDNKENDNRENNKVVDIKNNIKKLDIDIDSSNIIIKNGLGLQVETNNDYIKIKENDDKLFITEERYNIINNTDNKLIIYIPNDYLFDEVFVRSGAGMIEADMINAKVVDFEFGAGKVEIENLYVSNKIEIEGGAGEIFIKNSSISNLDLDMGLGNLMLNSSLYGENDIDAGVGKIQINLKDDLDNYKINVNKGLGNATLNGENLKNDIYYGDGLNYINIDGGVGNIEINSK